MYDQRVKNSREIEEEIRNSFKNFVFKNSIPRNSKIAYAPRYGKPVALLDVTSPGAVGYLKLAEEVLERIKLKAYK